MIGLADPGWSPWEVSTRSRRRRLGARDPRSPFAVALDMDGIVLAKGTFNTAPSWRSVLATAERRRGAAHA